MNRWSNDLDSPGDCLGFRRRLQVEPGCREAEFLDHAKHCPACALALESSLKAESQLRAALRMPTPDDLVARILLRQSFGEVGPRPRNKSWQGWYGLAAGLALAGFVALFALWGAPRESGLAGEVVALIQAAPYALAAEGSISRKQVAAALKPVGLSLSGDLGPVSFVGRCYIRGQMAGHLVVQGESARITVFLIPHVSVRAPIPIRSGHFSGMLIPSGPGAVAIVSAPGEPLEAVQERVRSAVLWPV